jgi:hypothetical protein
MRVPTGVPVALVAALTVAVATVGAPAQAATETGTDASHDQLSGRSDGQGAPWHPAKTHRAGDIIDNTVSYGTDLVVVTTYRAFATKGYTLFTWNIKTVDQKGPPYWTATLEVHGGKHRGVFTLADPIANPVACGGAVIDRAARTVTLTVPATCLGDPAWVRVGNGSAVFNGVRDYWDDARRDGTVKGDWRFGPTVPTG